MELFKSYIITFFLLISTVSAIGEIYCGTERSDVKHLSDAEAKNINYKPVYCSLDSFLLFDNMIIPASFSHKHFKRFPSEMQCYTVPCYIKFWQKEQDNDYHLVCCDSNYKNKFIAEVPSPECSESIRSGYAANYKSCRDLLDSLFPLMYNFKHYNKFKIKFFLTGILYHDYVHGQTGHAPKGLELHPVLSISY
jgi:hypothetical protein